MCGQCRQEVLGLYLCLRRGIRYTRVLGTKHTRPKGGESKLCRSGPTYPGHLAAPSHPLLSPRIFIMLYDFTSVDPPRMMCVGVFVVFVSRLLTVEDTY